MYYKLVYLKNYEQFKKSTERYFLCRKLIEEACEYTSRITVRKTPLKVANKLKISLKSVQAFLGINKKRGGWLSGEVSACGSKGLVRIPLLAGIFLFILII